MSVHAISPIRHGLEDGTVVIFLVGEELDEATFSAEQLRDFVTSGSAVELGKDRKYSTPPDPSVPVPDATEQLRDALIAQSQNENVTTATPEAATSTATE